MNIYSDIPKWPDIYIYIRNLPQDDPDPLDFDIGAKKPVAKYEFSACCQKLFDVIFFLFFNRNLNFSRLPFKPPLKEEPRLIESDSPHTGGDSGAL